MVAFWSSLSLTIIVLMAVSLLLAGVFAAFIMKNRENRRHMPAKARLRHAILGGRTIMVYCMALLFIPAGIVTFVGVPASSPETSESTEWTIQRQKDTVLNLSESTWKTLDSTQRLRTLEVILHIEAHYLGLSETPKLAAAVLGEKTIGKYDVSSHRILLKKGYLENCTAEESLNALCHEVFHAYQHQLLQLYGEVPDKYKELAIFTPTRIYKSEAANYVDGEDDFENYFQQTLERDARAYAEDSVRTYIECIEKYKTDS